jgi:hypothetical protein
MMVRIGIPHRGGRLAFHAFNHGYPAMVSASAFWSPKTQTFILPEASDVQELDFALDSAGFTAMRLWQAKGTQPGMAGIFPWTYEQYIELAVTVGASWWSQPDLCCEPEIARDQAQIDYRINATATLLEGTLQIVDRWSQELGYALNPPVPIIQGWSAADYTRSLDLMMQVWERWHSAPPVLIGVGSVCRRHLNHPTHGLLAIVSAIEAHLPAGSSLHLFGVKGSALSALKMFESVAAVDSMAYDFAARMSACVNDVPNDMEHRAAEMNRWMGAAQSRIEPSAGDQFRFRYA